MSPFASLRVRLMLVVLVCGMPALGLIIYVPQRPIALLVVLVAIAIAWAVGEIFLLRPLEALQLKDNSTGSSVECNLSCKLSDTELTKLNDRFRMAAAAISGIIYDWDLNSNTVDTQGLIDVLGYRSEEADHNIDWWRDRIHPEDLQRVWGEITDALLSWRLDYAVEYRMRHKDNRYLHIWDKGLIVRNVEGKALRVVGSMIDISDRLRAEKERDRFFDLSLDMMCIAGDGYLKRVNPAWSKILGFSSAELLQTPFLNLIHPEDHAIAQSALQHMAEGTPVADLEVRLLCKDNSYKWIAWTVNPVVAEGLMYGVGRDVSDRKQTEEAVRQSEERLRVVLENMPMMLDALDRNFNISVWNRECELVTGYSASEIIGNPNVLELLYPDAEYRQQMIVEWQQHTGDFRNWEWDITCKDGTKKTISWSNISRQFPISDWVTWAIGMDVSDRIAAEEGLRASQAMLQMVMDNIPQYICWKDRNSVFLGCNRNYAAVVGLSNPEEIVGKTDFDLPRSAEEIEFFRSGDRRVMNTDTPELHIIEPTLLADGKQAWLDTNKVPLHDAVGNVIGILATFEDITDRKQAQEELAKSNSWLRATLESTADGILVVDANRKIIGFNQKFVEMWCIPEFIMAMEDSDIALEFVLQQLKNPAEFLDKVMDLYAQSEAVSWDILEFKDNRIFERYSQPAWIGGESIGRVWSFRDITLAKLAEAQIRQLNETLEQRVLERTAQLEATNKELDSFSYSVSHDLRSPLRHINGFVNALEQHLIRDSTAIDPKASHYLKVIYDSSQKMGLLIDGLLSLSRMGRRQLALKPVNLGDLVERAIALTNSPTATDDDEVEFTVGNLPTVMGDPTLLQQVFSNLIHNAVKFSRNRRPAKVEINCLPDGTIFVKDNGVGFSMAYADQLFGAFQRLHSSTEFEGTGIGLAIAQRIIHRHGGSIWAESTPNQGAIFYFQIGEISR